MASYKIYFLNFCYQNWPSSEVKGLAELQNATAKAFFIEKVIFCPIWPCLNADLGPWNIQNRVEL